MLNEGRLVTGTLRVNKKNRSDAYVSTNVLDADIFICGSKDRNRALEGDLVAVELLDVDEVWDSKREKEEKKKRKDNAETGGGAGSPAGSTTASSGTGLRRKGSLKQRPVQKKNDDVPASPTRLLAVPWGFSVHLRRLPKKNKKLSEKKNFLKSSNSKRVRRLTVPKLSGLNRQTNVFH